MRVGHFVIIFFLLQACRNVLGLDGETCVLACPVDAYADTNSACQPCNGSCLIFSEERYITSVTEDLAAATAIATVRASDLRMTGRPIAFTITAGNGGQLFSIDPSSGVIFLTASLDYEARDSHSLLISAVDAGLVPVSLQTATATVLVLVSDVNDNNPTFSQAQYTAVVAENSAAEVSILEVVATDADSPPNAMVTYFISPEDINIIADVFSLDAASGVLMTLSALDFEQEQSYSFNVVAMDSGNPALSATAGVLVSVLDLNDVRPVFIETEVSLQLSELSPSGSSVVQLEAIDADSTSLTYDIIEGNFANSFMIDQASGLVSVSSLDYEQVQEFTLLVAVSDGVPNPLPSGTATVRLSVLDENDNAPVFQQADFTVEVLENSSLFSSIADVFASDLDSGNNSLIEYFISEGDNETFSITNEGVILLISNLDREAESSFELTITARDVGTPPLSSTAVTTILIGDVNDNQPIFQELPPVSLNENATPGTSIAVLTASDSDASSNAEVRYRLSTTIDHPFTVNPLTGEVTVEGPVDYETAMEYRVAVFAEDRGSPSLSSEALLIVNVNDLNDNPPMFSELSYSVIIPENLSIGASVLSVAAMDADSGVNAVVTYQTTSGSQFEINSSTGVISLARSLDFEQQTSYEFTVSATNTLADPPLASSVSVVVNVTEINEHSPVFSQEAYTATISEGVAAGELVIQLRAEDQDAGPSGEIEFEIISGNVGFAFEILSSGEVFTLGVLDREQRSAYELTVQAVDNGLPPLSASAILRVTILDVNDSPPRFTLTEPYTSSLIENAPLGSNILTTPPLEASDADSLGPNSDIMFEVTRVTPAGPFAIDMLTGQLQSVGSVDFEEVGSYEIVITAFDNGVPSLSSTATVLLEILDQNDNQPTIEDIADAVVFTEGENEILIAPNITITDRDSLPLRSVTISLSSPAIEFGQVGQLVLSLSLPSITVASSSNAQRLELSGSFTPSEASLLLSSLSYRNMDAEPSPVSRFVDISVSDGVFINSGRIEIIFQLINDNPPSVDLDLSSLGVDFSTGFTEEGDSVSLTGSTAAITDADSGAGGISQLTVELLDAVDGSSEGLLVMSIDSSTLQVQYGDNNHSITISAVEGDTASFEAFESILSTLRYFNGADEPQPPLQRTVQVIAFDEALSSQPATATVTITLVNDAPLLDLGGRADFQVEFVEDGGSVLLTSDTLFELTDSDDDQLANASVVLLNAVDGSGEMLLLSGSVPSSVSVLAEEHSVFIDGPAPLVDFAAILQAIRYNNVLQSPSLDVRAVEFTVSDGAAVSTATTFVTFNAVNDPPILDLNGPQTGVNFAVEFLEGSPAVPVASSSLTLRDVDSPVLVSTTVLLQGILDGNFERLSVISSHGNPSVTATASLIQLEGLASPDEYADTLRSITYINTAEEPREGERVVQFTVSDGENATTVQSVVTVIQVNDPPELVLNGGVVFEAVYTEGGPPIAIVNPDDVIIRDNDDTTLAVLIVAIRNAVDGTDEILRLSDPTPDNSLNAEISFDSAQSTVTYTVQLSPTSSTIANYIQLISSLAYRHGALEPTAGTRTVSISVSDGVASSATQQTLLSITLINDNIPAFGLFIYQVVVRENVANITALTVSATDGDSNTGLFADQGTVLYSIIGGNGDGFFEIGAESGVLTLVLPKDREASTASPAITVQATNPAPLDVPGAFPTAFVIVSIEDVNDNIPQFIGAPYSVEIAEHSAVGLDLVTVQATDADVGSNAFVQYTISQGNLNSVFELDPVSGVLSIANSQLLDYELFPSYLLSITAVDAGSPPLSNVTIVEVSLSDINDNRPTFSVSVFTASISESAPLGSLVLAVSASDADSGTNGAIEFALEGTLQFNINSTTGSITTSVALDREVQSSFSFQVTAVDFGSPRLTSTAEVVVAVLDENDNAPVFQQEDYFTSALESLPIGQSVLRVQASDLDAGSNAEITYSINGSVPFNIDPSSGVISISLSLDRETVDLYIFQVLAEDFDFTVSSTVTLAIADANDNPPVFSQVAYQTALSESTPLLGSVITVTALDADTGSNAQVLYSLVNEQSAFSIDPSSGEVFTRALLDREERASYILVVQATDQGSTPLSAQVNIAINITDVNDNPPVFEFSRYQFTIAENTPPQQLGFTVASDADVGSNGDISYAIPEQNLPFSIDEITGALSTVLPLDREGISLYNFTVSATDNGQPAHSGVTMVAVTVGDANDNSPVFTQSSYTAAISEDYTVGTVVLTLLARDSDSGLNAAITYHITSSTAPGVFDINALSGNVQLLSDLDAEMDTLYSLTVETRDSGTPQLTATAAVEVLVSDVNDNAVEISQVLPAVVFVEEGPPVAIATSIVVMDNDVSAVVQNATVELTTPLCCDDQLLVDANQFPGANLQVSEDSQLVLVTGPVSVTTVEELLRSVSYHNINPEPLPGMVSVSISVFDGVFTASVDVSITISTINDNQPVVFLDGGNRNSSVIFLEDSTGVFIAQTPSVEDADSDFETLESISLLLLNPTDGAQEFISASPLAGTITVFPPSGGATLLLAGPALPVEFAQVLSTVQYHTTSDNPTSQPRVIQVTAFDGGLSGEASFAQVEVVPINDPPLLFLSSSVNFNVSFIEGSSPVSLSSSQLEIRDPDSLVLESATVRLQAVLDSGNEFILYSTTLSVLRLSDSDIQFLGPATLGDFEQALLSVRYSNNATDPTAGDRLIEFTIRDGQLSATAFTAVSVLTVNDAPVIDLNGPQEGIDFATLFIEGGQPIFIAPPTATIMDTDNELLSSITIAVLPPSDVGQESLTVPDQSELGITATYNAISSTLVLSGEANIDNYTSALLTVQYLNSADEPTGSVRLIEVIASDGQLSSEPAVVMVTFQFFNDPPSVVLDSVAVVFSTVFVEGSEAVSVSNPRSAEVMDPDSTTLAYLAVELHNILDGDFEALNFTDPTAGELMVVISTDPLLQVATYNFTFAFNGDLSVYSQLLTSFTYINLASEPNATQPRLLSFTAHDGLTLSAPTTAEVSIRLVDDNEPLFEQNSYSFSALESLSAGAGIGRVVAVDLDFGDAFLYAVSESVPFVVNALSGEITVSEPLDRERQDEYIFTISLTQTSAPFESFPDVATVTVLVVDINDNTPVFNKTTFIFVTPEDTLTGSEIGTATAEDADTGSNAELVYSLTGTEAFTIATLTGEITTLVVLDRETAAVYQFSVIVRDSGNPSLTAQAAVTVMVEDVNDNVPQFSQATYSTQLIETSPVGTTAVILSATDGDIKENARLEFALEEAGVFSINAITGAIVTTASLSPFNHSLTASVVDGGNPRLSSTVSVTVEIISLDSIIPVFTFPTYEGAVRENSPPGVSILTVSASDPHTGQPVSYLINSESEDFFLDSASGELFSNQSFDRESQNTYQLQIEAVSFDGLRSGFTQAVVTINDANDFAPVFTQSLYEFSLNENSPSGTTLGAVFAQDLFDISSNSLIVEYSSTDPGFAIDLLGIVTSTVEFDREQQASYSLEVLAIDGGFPPLTGTALLAVTVTDRNDNPPRFIQPVYAGSLTEDEPIGTSILTVEASDMDTGSNAEITFSTNSTEFAINLQTGVLSTRTLLDFEQREDYEVFVFASDAGTPPLSSTARVLIQVLDVDDSASQFTQAVYNSQVLEGQSEGELILQVEAVDSDSDSTNSVSYAILMTNAFATRFEIDQNGSIFTAVVLDREEVSQYTLIIEASNLNHLGSVLTATSTVLIEVQDLNDNRPQFIGEPYVFTVAEDASQGDLVGSLLAVDADVGGNANISGYSITEGNIDGVFEIDSFSGRMTVLSALLDREIRDSYDISVAVTDGGEPLLISSTNVTVLVTDVNDQVPYFSMDILNASIAEDAAIGATIFTAEAFDDDLGSNAELSYAISGTNTVFSINPTSGEISLISTLDFEAQSSYAITLLAADQGTPALTGSALLEVSVQDVDDLPVQFIPDTFSAGVFESSAVGTPVIAVMAQDADTVQGNPITYSLPQRNEEDPNSLPFAIDRLSGEITVAGLLDRESIERYVVSVLAGNVPGVSAMATVTIAILDVNDVAPEFNQSLYEFQVVESDPLGMELGQVMAEDGDLEAAGTIASYNIQGANEFSISPTGVISIAVSLDFETTQSYRLNLTATDGGMPSLTGRAEAIITILDFNDNPPQFTMENFTTAIPEDEPIGSVVFTAIAEDRDSGSNGELIFSLSSPGSVFAIDPSTGEVNLTSVLAVQTYTLLITASDLGIPQLSTTATLEVVVTDSNERPFFSQELFLASISEGAAVETEVIRVEALDPDSGVNADITYSIQPDIDVFVITPDSGVISVAQQLDFEQVTSYSLSVVAVDSGLPPLTATATVMVAVTDANDNTPQFSESFFTAEVPEDAAVGSVLLVVNASDADSGNNGVVTFSLSQNSSGVGFFSIDAITGDITSLQSLDFESISGFELLVVARDGGVPALSSSAPVFILLTDIDDNRPVFEQPQYNASVSEALQTGSVFLTVVASDADSGENSVVEYRFVDASTPFEVNQTSGELTAVSPGLDRELVERYVLLVQAFNPFSSTFAATVTVTVEVLDTNDNPPQFDSNTLMFSIQESTPAGNSIGRVLATDQDSGSNSAITYSIEPQSSLVAIDALTGELATRQLLDFETQPLIAINVVAMDNGSLSLSAAAVVTIALENINDSPPEIALSPSLFPFQEDSDPVNIGMGISISDPDMLPLSQATVKLFLGDSTSAPPPPSDFIQLDRAFSESQGLTLSSSTSCINITGAASVETYTAVLLGLVFGSTAQEPLQGLRAVALQVSDGVFDSDIAILIVTVRLINDNPPELDLSDSLEGIGFQTTFREDGFSVFIVASDVSIIDPDGDEIENVTITITNALDGPLEQIDAFGFGSVQVERISSGIVLIGPATPQEFELVLQTASYVNTAEEPSGTQVARIVEFTASDSALTSVPAVATIAIIAVNDRPVILLGGNTRDVVLEYSEVEGELSLVSDELVLFDEDSPLLSFVNITIVNSQPGVDQFNYSTQGSSSIEGEFLSGTLLLSGPASVSEFTTVLRSVVYINQFVQNDQFELLTGGRSIEFTANDGLLSSELAIAFITFSSVNDPPLLDLNGPQPGANFITAFPEGMVTSIPAVSPTLTLSDADSDVLQSASIELTGIIDTGFEAILFTDAVDSIAVTVSGALVTLVGSAPALDYQLLLASLVYENTAPWPSFGSRIITFAVSDGESSSPLVTSTIVVSTINDPPVLSLALAGVPFVEASGPVALFEAVSIEDRDNDTLAFLEVVIENALDGILEVIGTSESIPALDSSSELTGNNLRFMFSFSPTSEGTLTQFSALIFNLTYDNTAPEPTDIPRVITLAIFDGVNSSNVVSLTLPVVLLNDNPPMFDNIFGEVNVPEDEDAGVAIFQAMASDADTDSTIAFSFDAPSDTFSIDTSTGVVTLAELLDREVEDFYSLIITASDGVASDTMQLNITVTDVNDNAPAFDQQVFTGSVLENSPLATQVLQVSATDADTGSNAALRYAIRGGNDGSVFAISQGSGLLTTNGAIDFEAVPSYSLIISAQDSGTPSLSSTVVVVITITDLNDNPPIFMPDSATVPILEDAPLNSVVYTVQAFDADINTELVYSLSTPSAVFAIDPSTGTITLTGTLDFESITSYFLMAVASDGSSVAIFNLTVLVVDVDDNAPIFVQDMYAVSLLESVSVGEVLDLGGQPLQVLDGDQGSNAAVLFSIVSGDPDTQFMVNAVGFNTAEIIVVGALDRERRDSYFIEVLAENPSNPMQFDSAFVNITILDINDSPPLFDVSLYRFNVSENSSPGTVAGSVFASDADIGSNGLVTYQIASGDPNGNFDVTTEGDIEVFDELDRENTTMFVLTVLAQDAGSVPLTSTSTVIITILDENDNAPLFIADMITATLAENAPTGSTITTLTAVDDDQGSNAAIMYSIHPDAVGFFQIHPTSGVLATLAPLDFEQDPSEVVVTVFATDGGIPPLSAEAQVLVVLQDVNEFEPQFDSSLVSIQLPEDTPVFTRVLTVAANDSDGGIAGIVEYTLLQNSDVFAIDNETGEISTVATLDREATILLQLQVRASNTLVNPVLFSVATVEITVLDVNDNAPEFTQESYTAAVTTRSEPGTLVVTVTATDADSGTNSDLSYSLLDPTAQFSIAPSTGTISLSTAFSSPEVVTLTVVAADGGSPSLSSSVAVTITVILPVQIEFTLEGAGFPLQFSTSTAQEFGLFINQSPGESGRVSASLGGVVEERNFTTEEPQAVTVRGVLLRETVWYDLPEVGVVVQVADAVGGVRCAPAEVVVRVLPDTELQLLADLTPQVYSHIYMGTRVPASCRVAQQGVMSV